MPAKNTDYTKAAELFRAVGHPTRIRVLVAVADVHRRKGLSPKLFTDAHPETALGTAAYHFRALAEAGLIEEICTEPRRGAREHFFAITARGRRALALLN